MRLARGLVLLALVASAVHAEPARRLLDFDPLQALLDKTGIDTKQPASRAPFLPKCDHAC